MRTDILNDRLTVICGDALDSLRSLHGESVQCCVTSPPYWGLRDYGNAGQLGLEKTPEEYVTKMVEVFREVRRVVANDGTLWLNLGDSYAGSWGAQSRPDGNNNGSTIEGGSMLSHRQIKAHPKTANTGSLKNTPGIKAKDLVGIPWMVAFALRADGWYLRQDIIWSKPNPMPESVTDRCTKAHEYVFLLSKSPRYYYDAEAIQEQGSIREDERPLGERSNGNHNGQSERIFKPKTDKQRGHGRRHAGFNDRWDAMEKSEQRSGMRNKRDVWNVATAPFPEAHFATYPPDLIKPCILAGAPAGGTVLDPFAGSGTTGMVALELGRKAILIELNPEYVKLIERRCDVTPGFAI